MAILPDPFLPSKRPAPPPSSDAAVASRSLSSEAEPSSPGAGPRNRRRIITGRDGDAGLARLNARHIVAHPEGWTAEGLRYRSRDGRLPASARRAYSLAIAQTSDPRVLESLGTAADAHASEAALVSTRISQRAGRVLAAPATRHRVAEYIARCPRSQYSSRRPPLILYSWDRGHPEGAQRHVATCGSWRCDGCARKAGAIAYARMLEALATYRPEDCLLVVLTLDQAGRYSGETWHDAADVYASIGERTQAFLRRLDRWCAAMFGEGVKVGSRWVQTVEAHRNGWPHANLIIVCPELAAWVRTRIDAKVSLGATARESTLVDASARCPRRVNPCTLRDLTMAAGWGPQSTMEPARSNSAVAGYIVKLAHTHDRTTAEIAKLTQRPDIAYKGFRRIRSGKGFLPPRRHTGQTGALLQSWVDDSGQAIVHVYGRRSRADATVMERWATRSAEVDDVVQAEAVYVRSQWREESPGASARARAAPASSRAPPCGIPPPDVAV